jgi:hypothetical protein
MNDGWAPDRRRADRRIVTYTCQARVEGEADPMRVGDLSAGGMVIESPRPLVAGVGLTFVLETEVETIGPLRGQVAHSRLVLAARAGDTHTCIAGVAFDVVTADQAAAIARVLAEIDQRRRSRSQDMP